MRYGKNAWIQTGLAYPTISVFIPENSHPCPLLPIAAGLWTLYSIFLKRWPSDFSPIAQLVLIISGGVLLLVPLTLLEVLSGLPLTQTIWGWKTVALVAAAAVMPGAGAYLAYATLQKALGAARASLTLYLGPLYAAVTAFFVLAEPVYFYYLVGAALFCPAFIWHPGRCARFDAKTGFQLWFFVQFSDLKPLSDQ